MPLRNLSDATWVCFKKGDILIKQGEQLEFLYYLIEGEVHRELLVSNGTEVILTIKSVKDNNHYLESLVGVLVLYDKYEQYSVSNCSFVAHTPCQCYKIPVAAYHEFAVNHAEDIFKQLLDQVMASYQILFEMYYTKHNKGSCALVCEAILSRSIIKNGEQIFGLDISHAELGKLLGIHPVNISKIISLLVKENALTKLNGRGYIVTNAGYIQDVADNVIELSYRYVK